MCYQSGKWGINVSQPNKRRLHETDSFIHSTTISWAPAMCQAQVLRIKWGTRCTGHYSCGDRNLVGRDRLSTRTWIGHFKWWKTLWRKGNGMKVTEVGAFRLIVFEVLFIKVWNQFPFMPHCSEVEGFTWLGHPNNLWHLWREDQCEDWLCQVEW